MHELVAARLRKKCHFRHELTYEEILRVTFAHPFLPNSPTVASINASAKSAKRFRAGGTDEEVPGPIIAGSVRDSRSTYRGTLERARKAPKPCQERAVRDGRMHRDYILKRSRTG